MVKLKFTVADFLVMAAIVGLALFLLVLPYTRKSDNLFLSVTVENDEIQRYRLDQDQEIAVEGRSHRLLIRVENGEAFVLSSDCPDKICQNSGRISKAGEVIICAPAQISIQIEGGEDDVDFVAG